MSMIGKYRRLTAVELKALLEKPEKLDSLLYSEEDADDRHLDIDKSWQAIHFLLNHDPWDGEYPYSDVVLGGSVVSDEDIGYGPACILPRLVERQIRLTSGLTPQLSTALGNALRTPPVRSSLSPNVS